MRASRLGPFRVVYAYPVLETEQTPETSDRPRMAREPQRVPSQGLVAGDDRLAEAFLERLDDAESTHSRARQKETLDVRRVERLRRREDARRRDRGNLGIRILVEGAEAMRASFSARNAASAAVGGVVQATPGRAARNRAKTSSSPITIVPEVQPYAMTSIRPPARISSAAPVMPSRIAPSVATVISDAKAMRLT